MSDIASLPLTVAMFPSARPTTKEAIGEMEEKTWGDMQNMLSNRRVGLKDGPCMAFARFKVEAPFAQDGKPHKQMVRRLKINLEARTAVALDIESNKTNGEVPPALLDISNRIKVLGWAALLYTTHSHNAQAPRYRIVVPLTVEIAAHLPVSEAIADMLDISGVLDASKLGASSVFYLPSSEPGKEKDHAFYQIDGAAINANWIIGEAQAILDNRDQCQADIRGVALAESERRQATNVAARFKPTVQLIEGIRDHLDLAAELTKHGYQKVGERYLYPGSESRIPGVHILRGNDGVERVFSHHTGDPLAVGNLPSWCGVKAIDVVDVVAILDFGGDQKKALHELGIQFKIGEPLQVKVTLTEPKGFSDVPPPEGQDTTTSRSEGKKRRPMRAAAEGDTSGWSEPVDFLTQETGGSPRLGPQHVPAALWPFVLDTSARMGVDPFAVMLSTTVSAAAIMHDDWKVQPKKYDTTWTENARLWGSILGGPSILKTPVIAEATRPIEQLEIEARKRWKEALALWRIEENKAKIAKQVPPPRPKLDRYMIEGATTEAISEILRDDDEAKLRSPGKKVLSRHDEMSEFFGNLDRFRPGGNGSGDRGAYLRLYNGGRYTIDRINRGNFACPNWSACFLGGCQPGPIQRIARDSADDGLLQRFIFCVPDGQLQGLDREPDAAASARYARLFPTLAGMTPAPPSVGHTIQPVVLHDDAHRHREDIDALARAMAAMPDVSNRMKSMFGKWSGLFARLCLTFHLIEIADHRASGDPSPGPVVQVIPERIARQVALFMREIMLPHQLRAEAMMFSTDQTGHACWIAGYILSKKMLRISARDIMRDYRALAAPEARAELQAVMASLVSLAWLNPEEPNNPARGVISWRVNPMVHEHFRERADVERARRLEAREEIKKAIDRTRAAAG